jgi:TRAP transporter TAXI family solute receptor
MLAQLISNKVVINGQKMSATAETAGASAANAQLLGRNEIESAFVAADILDAAFNGRNQFDGKPLKSLRALAALYPEQVQLVTAAKSNIRTFRDLKGKSVSSGAPGSGQWQLLGDLLEAHGMTRKDISEDLSSFAQSVDKIKDGNLTASLITAGAPTASVTDLANTHDIRIVPLAGPEIDALRKKQPYYAQVQLPANTYKGQPAPVDTLAVMAIWATHEALADNIAYEVTKALFENTSILGQVHPKGKEITLNTALQSVSIPLHPGAQRYYKEKGLLK